MIFEKNSSYANACATVKKTIKTDAPVCNRHSTDGEKSVLNRW